MMTNVLNNYRLQNISIIQVYTIVTQPVCYVDINNSYDII